MNLLPYIHIHIKFEALLLHGWGGGGTFTQYHVLMVVFPHTY